MDILKNYRVALQVVSIFGLMFVMVAADINFALRAAIVVALLIINFFVMKVTGQVSSLIDFVNDARQEIIKVVWPSRHEALRTTAMIAVVVTVVSILLWILDSITLAIFAKLIQII